MDGMIVSNSRWTGLTDVGARRLKVETRYLASCLGNYNLLGFGYWSNELGHRLASWGT